MRPSLFNDVHELLHACLSEAVHELFDCYGQPITPISDDGPLYSAGASVASSIGYSHPMVSGSLTLIGTTQLVRTLLEGTGADLHSVADMRDAGGELINMLVGRMKNKCCRYDLVLKIGMPTTFHGIDLRLAQAPMAQWTSVWSVFSSGGDRFFVRLDALIANGYTSQMMCFREIETPPGAVEGDMLLFED